MFEVLELSKRNDKETCLITPEPSINFTYQAALIWNVARGVLKLDDFSKKVSFSIKVKNNGLIWFNDIPPQTEMA